MGIEINQEIYYWEAFKANNNIDDHGAAWVKYRVHLSEWLPLIAQLRKRVYEATENERDSLLPEVKEFYRAFGERVKELDDCPPNEW